MANGEKGATSESGNGGQKTHHRKWQYILIAVVILIGVLIWLAPYLASTRAAKNIGLSYANEQIKGRIEAEGISLSWGGPTRLTQVRAFDPDGKQVLQVGEVVWSGGLWRAITGVMNFGRVEISDVSADLRFLPQGGVSMAQAFEPRKPSGKKAALPEPRGQIVLKNGSLHLTQPDGRAYDVNDIGAQLTLDTLDTINGQLAAVAPSGGAIQASFAMKHLVTGQELRPDHSSGQIAVKTPEDLSLGPVIAFASGKPARGTASLDLTANFDSGKGNAQLALLVKQLQAWREAATAEPIDLSVRGGIDASADKVAGQLAIGGPGELQTLFNYAPNEKVPGERPEGSLGAAILSGKPFGLPQFSAGAKGALDLAKIARAIPALLPLRPDTSVASGKLEVSDVAVTGGAQPAAHGQLQIADVVLLRQGKQVTLEPLSLKFDAAVTESSGAVLRQAALQAPFGHLQATATSPKFEGVYQFDLAGLRDWLAQFMDIGNFELGGQIAGGFGGTGGQDGGIDTHFTSTVHAFHYGQGQRHLDIQTATVQHEGQVVLARKQIEQYVVRRNEVHVGEGLALNATGKEDVAAGAFAAEANLSRVDLAQLAQYAKELGILDMERYAGMAKVKAIAHRDSADAPILLAGQGSVDNLQVGGQSVSDKPVTAKWSGVEFSPGGSTLAVDSVQLQSSFAQFHAQNVRVNYGQQFELVGQANASADVQKTFRVATLAGAFQQTPEMAGTLKWAGQFAAPNPNELIMQGKGGIQNFTVGTGQQAVAQEQVNFDYSARLDRQRDLVNIQKADLSSPALSAQLAGNIAQISKEPTLDLKGKYTGSWEQLTAILHQLAPGTKETVEFAGTTSSDFVATGPARAPNVTPTYRGVAASAEVGWASAKLYGVSIGKVKLSPRLDQGRLMLPMTAMPASGGKMNVGCEVDLSQPTPKLRMPGQTGLFERVQVNPEMGKYILSRINPIFADTVSMQGYVTLQLNDVDLPLGEEIKRTGHGTGHLDLSELKVQPGGVFKILADLGGLVPGQTQAMQVKGVDFRIDNGRVYYKDFTVILAGLFDLKFYGSVGFDDTIDLTVSLPVRPRVLETLGFKGPVATAASKLTDVRIDVPLRGSRLLPTLDMSSVNLKPIMQRVGQTLMLNQTGSAMRGILTPKPGQSVPGQGILEAPMNLLKPKPAPSPPPSGGQ